MTNADGKQELIVLMNDMMISYYVMINTSQSEYFKTLSDKEKKNLNDKATGVFSAFKYAANLYFKRYNINYAVDRKYCMTQALKTTQEIHTARLTRISQFISDLINGRIKVD